MAEEENRRLAQYAAELGLDYTPAAIRQLRRRHGDQGARDWMDAVAALLALADLVFIEDAAVPFDQQSAKQTLARYGGDYDAAADAVRARAAAAFEEAQRAYDRAYDEAWLEVITTHARRRHAIRSADRTAGTLGRSFIVVMILLGDAGLDTIRTRSRRDAERLVDEEIDRTFPHPVDREARDMQLRRAPELQQQIDLFAGNPRFSARVERILNDCRRRLSARADEGWRPDPHRVIEVDRVLSRLWAAWHAEHRKHVHQRQAKE